MISVVITTYYRNERLERALQSVRSQTYDQVETIVVDGSESGNARAVVETYDGVQYVCPDRDPGFHRCRELGVRESSGEFVQFLDDDDWLRPTKLERATRTFRDGVGVVYCGIEHQTSGKTVLPDPDARGDVLHRALAFDMAPALPSTWTIRRGVLEEILPFAHPDGADDEGTHIELSQVTTYEFVDEPLVVLGTENEQSVNKTWDYVEGLEFLLEEYAHLYERAPAWVKASAREKVHRNRGNMYLREALWSLAATREFVRAARYSPDHTVRRSAQAALSLLGRPGMQAGESLVGRVRQ